MATLVRVKRRLDEEPLDALVLNCKKRKICVDDKENIPENLSTVLQFAGTVQEDENIQSLLKKRNISDLKELKDQFKKAPINLNKKIHAQVKESSKNNRFKVVNCFRSSNLDLSSEEPVIDKDIESSSSSKEEKDSSNKYTVFDIETDLNENDNKTEDLNKLPVSQYVYDVYYADSYSDDVGQAHLGDFDCLSIYPLNDPLIYGSVRDNGLDQTASDDESEDSNAECNWKNDYPDESDMESVNEDDMVKAVENLEIGEDLSSDTEEENFVYSIEGDDDVSGEIQDLDEDDVNKYGKMYAKFKAHNKNIETKGLDKEFYYGDIDEDEYYY